MKPERLISGLVLGLLLVAAPAFAQGNVQKLKTDEIAKALGKEGDLAGDMYKVSFPRSDLTVNVGNVAIKPALALMAWAAFVKSGNDAFTYGDLVVLEDEVKPGNRQTRGKRLGVISSPQPPPARDASRHVYPLCRARRRSGTGKRTSRGIGAHQEPIGHDAISTGDKTRNCDRDRKNHRLSRHQGGNGLMHRESRLA